MSALKSWLTAPRILTVVIVVAVVVALVGIFEKPSDTVEVGERVDGFVLGDGAARSSVGTLGFGRVRIQTDVGTTAYVGTKRLRSEGSQRWVEIDWDTRDRAGHPLVWPGATSSQRREPSAQLILVAGGERYVLVERLRASNASGSAVMKIPDAEDLRLVVRSGGKDRPVRPETRSAPGGDLSRTRCSRDSSSTEFSSPVSCTLTAERAPYVAGLGWAPARQDWLVVEDAHAEISFQAADGSIVTRWEKKRDDGVDRVDYAPSGKPRLTLSVTGATTPKHTYGKPTSKGTRASLPVQAYLVPSDRPTEMTLRYRVAAVPAPDEEPVAGAPSRTTVDLREVHLIDPVD